MANPSTYFKGRFQGLAPAACIIDTSLPTFAGIASVVFQLDGSAVVTWATATSSKPPVRYEIYVAAGSVSAGALFVTANRVAFAPGALLAWRIFVLRDQVTYFMPGQVYTFGIRAVDSENYSDTNTVILTATALYPNYGSLAAAVWDQLKSAHTIAGSFGDFLDAKVSLTQLASVALTQFNSLTTAIGTLQTAATALTQYTNLQTTLGTLQTSATALSQFNALNTAIGTLQTAATALSQFNSIITAIGTPQQAATALTQYNNLQTAIAALQTAATALTQYNNLQTAIGATQSAATALSQFNTIISGLTAIIADIVAIPTNPLLTTDSRLNNLDATISSRQDAATAATQYTAIQTAIALLQTAATALTQFNALITAIGTGGGGGNVTVATEMDATITAFEADVDVTPFSIDIDIGSFEVDMEIDC